MRKGKRGNERQNPVAGIAKADGVLDEIPRLCSFERVKKLTMNHEILRMVVEARF